MCRGMRHSQAEPITERKGWVVAVLVASTAGFCSSLTGLGGGLLLVSTLTAVLGYPVKRAIGSSLATMAFVSLVGCLAGLEVGGASIQWRWLALLAAGSLLGAVAGSGIALRIPELPGRTGMALVPPAACLLLFGVAWAATDDRLMGTIPSVVGPLFILILGGIAGLVSVLFGLDGGLVFVPALALLCGGLPFEAVRATSLAAMVPAAALGAHRYARMGHVDGGRALIPAGLAGAVLGVAAASVLPVWVCRVALAVLLFPVALPLFALARQLVAVVTRHRWQPAPDGAGRRGEPNAS